jgi:hypothetical protein
MCLTVADESIRNERTNRTKISLTKCFCHSFFISLETRKIGRKRKRKGNYDNDCTRIFPQNFVLRKLVIFHESVTMRAFVFEIKFCLLLIRFKMASNIYGSFLIQVTDFETFMQTHFSAISLSFVFRTSHNIRHNVRFDFLIIMFSF